MTADTGKAAVFVGTDKDLEIREYPVGTPAAGQVLLSLRASGICGTDIHILDGRLAIPPQYIPGHEFIGQVEALGDDASVDGLGNSLADDDTAIACVAQACGECFNCRRGETASCLSFGVTYVKDPDEAPHFFGGFAEYLMQPAANCVKVPDGLNIDAVAAFPCAGPTCLRAFDYAGSLEGGELVVVQGTGPVGLFATAYAAAAGCTVLAIGSDSHPGRLELAKDLGAKTALDYRKTSAEERLQIVQDAAAELNRGDGADVVLEASGSPSAIPEGMNLLRTRGTYVIPGQYSASGAVAIQPEMITFKALRLIGSGQYKLQDIGTYLDFLIEHPELQAKFARCITHRFTVENANAAIGAVRNGETVKAVFSKS